MAISISTDITDSKGKEVLEYGTADFPIAFFDDDLTKVRVPWHWHEQFEIVYIINGEVIINIGRDEFVLKAGEGYFLNSGILHSARLITDKGWQHAMVFDPHVIASENDIVWNHYVSPISSNNDFSYLKLSPDIPWQKEILDLSERTWNNGAYESEDYPLTVRSSLGRIMSLIIGNYQQYNSSENKPLYKEEIRIKETLNFIEEHYRETLDIEQIAQSAHVSVSTLLRMYHNVLHTTPISFLIGYRIERIADNLKNDLRSPIGDIAFANGFNDISYFNRCFKKAYGMTPKQYRQQQASK